jgi:hypothetical protein
LKIEKNVYFEKNQFHGGLSADFWKSFSFPEVESFEQKKNEKTHRKDVFLKIEYFKF